MKTREPEDFVDYYNKEGIFGDKQAQMRRDEFHSFLATRIESVIKDCAPQSLLDVGCAEGRYVFSSLTGSNRGVGVDVSDAKLERARLLASQLGVTESTSFIHADAHDLPFENGSFDVVLCSQVLEHLNNPNQAMQELSRVASSHVIVSTPVWSCLSPLGFGSPYRSRDYKLCKDGHIHWFSSQKLRKMAQESGLDVCRIEPICGRYPLRRLLRSLPGGGA
ncbi:MAG: methyltransferase domain-containing protein [Armatimonadota bacterium]|nr:methyltransferase domain-containing protein [Armatimonadota bacterium]